jgi:hypothetical protein
MTKHTKDLSEYHEMLILGGPDPLPVGEVKAITKKLFTLKQQISAANPESNLLNWVNSGLDSIIESTNHQRHASNALEAVLGHLHAQEKVIRRKTRND